MSVVTITIDGADETANVLYETAHFESQVNGVAGTCAIRVRDLNLDKNFVGGAPLVLAVDGQTVWRGFVATAVRTYVFPVVETDPGLGRFWDITGTDVNILLTRRIVFEQTTPTQILAPLLPAHTADTTAITELFADWLDLSGDGLDTTTLVENVGDTTWTQSGRAWMGSNTWAQAMHSIASLPAAIFYIDPDLNFVYTDVDTPNAAFALSDTPDGTTTKGYSSMEVLQDGSSLANDVLAWGIGYGSSVPVFIRDEDAASQATHGLWQLALTAFGVYEQTTIERIAASIIDGSPQSKRGAKNDRVAVMCTTYEPGLRVAQKVDFSSEVFGFTDVIPIRKMEIDFVGPDTPKYQLTLSHEIDTPLSLIDPFHLYIPGIPPPPPFPCPPPLVRGPNGQCILPPLPPPPSGCVCGITDTFTRTETGTWGMSDAGIAWENDITGSGEITVEGTYARFFSTTSGDFNTAYLPYVRGASFSIRFQINLKSFPGAASWYTAGTIGGSSYSIEDFGGGIRLRLVATGASTATLDPLLLDADQWYEVRWQQSTGTSQQIKFWPVDDPEPGAWTLEQDTTGQTVVAAAGISFEQSNDTSSDFEIWFDSLDVQSAVGLGSPSGTVVFDDFNRVNASDWGAPSSGDGSWNAFFAAGGGFNQSTSVDGSAGVLTSEYHSVQSSPGSRTVGTSFLTSEEDYEIDVTFSFDDDPADAPGDDAPVLGLDMMLRNSADQVTISYRYAGDGTVGNVGSLAISGADVTDVFTTAVPVLTASTVYHLTFEVLRSLDTIRAKVYTGGDPGWMLSTDITAASPSWPVLGVGLVAIAGGLSPNEQTTVRIDEITRSIPANSGDASAAVNRCTAIQFDDFERSVGGSWGFTTPSNYEWETTNASGTFSQGVSAVTSPAAFVIGSSATLAVRHLVVGLLPEDGGTQPWMQAPSFVMTVRFRIQAIPTSTNYGQFIFTWREGHAPDPTLDGERKVVLKVNNGSVGSISATAYPSGTNTYSAAKTDWLGGTESSNHWYLLKWDLKPGEYSKFKVWLETAGEPLSWTELADSGPTFIDQPTSFVELCVDISTSGVTNNFFIDTINFDYDGKPCYPDGPPPSTGTPLNAWICEQFDPVTTTLTLGSSFLPNSTEVYLNGLLQSQSNYTQDGVAGTITFDFVPTTTDHARVCYWSVS